MALQFPTLKLRSAVRTCLRLALTGHLSEGCRNHLAMGGDRSQYSLRVQPAWQRRQQIPAVLTGRSSDQVARQSASHCFHMLNGIAH